MQLKNKTFMFLAKQRPLKGQTTRSVRNAGRNNFGRITIRHQGGGVKQLYRKID